MKEYPDFSRIEGFQWDKGNFDKNWIKHSVSNTECEEPFFNIPFIVKEDSIHSHSENRFYALGQTDADRMLFIVFTIRNNLIRVISARDMSRNEKNTYEKIKKDSQIQE